MESRVITTTQNNNDGTDSCDYCHNNSNSTMKHQRLLQVCMGFFHIMLASSAMLQPPSASASRAHWKLIPCYLMINHPLSVQG